MCIRDRSKAALGYVLANLFISATAGLVVFITLEILGVPFALLFGLWVLLVDFLPQIGGALAGFPTVLFALGPVSYTHLDVYKRQVSTSCYPLSCASSLRGPDYRRCRHGGCLLYTSRCV